ncbi:transporter [Subtercola sp. PAMC28395]|uniref:transporter n=1 Tax=Subtercola sp. PAMC28395 TaxID=2846775 RepID=UPI001C0D3742|nr:transporter [Subtercola sp. PAMC28395]QWT23732.1 transporter [Subtercola sp. PAMC28395]
MVATLLRLRFRVLANTLKRSTWQLVAVIIGAIYGMGVLVFVVFGLVALAFAPVELASTIIVLAGSALILGWIAVPLVAVGVDQTLEPAKLAQFPLPRRTLLLGLALAGVLGVPGIITSIAALATTATWFRSPIAAVAALVCAVIAVLTCVVGSRMVTALSVSLASKRRFREVSGILVFIPLILLGPISFGIARGVAKSTDALPGLAHILGWTPLGAAWSVPADVAVGDFGAASVKFLIALATLTALVLIWSRSLATALETPPVSSGKRVARGKIGFFGLLPATPAGAVAARSLSYWVRDPRYARQLIVVPLIPVLLYFYSNNMGSFGLFNATGPIVAFLLSLATYADVSYDGTAFATHVADGVRGVDDRLGRAVALAIVSVPFVAVLTVGSVAITNSWPLLPALAGMALGAALSGIGLTAVTSARIIIPVPASGDNPFKSAPGAGFTTALSSFATWGILLLLTLPEAALGVSSIVFGSALLGWLALLVGIFLGLALAVAGIRVGGTILDRSAPEILSRLKALRGA